MKKMALFLLSMFLLSDFGFALKVVESELSKGKRVVFKKYQGRYRRLLTRYDKRIIGVELARRSRFINRRYRLQNKYSIIRAIDRRQRTKFDADIFSIDWDAKIVDINAIRVVIGAYLETKYGYSEKDGLLLAKFITFYNALYRRQHRYFASKYKRVVMRYVRWYNAGISTDYRQWAGKTRVLIPLSANAKRGILSALDSSEITKRRVIERLRKRKDKGISDRKKIVKFKKREVKERKKIVARKRRELKRKKRILKKKEEVQKKRSEKIAKRKKLIRKKLVKLRKTKDPKERRKIRKEIRKEKKNIRKETRKLERDKRSIRKIKKAIKKDEKRIKDEKKIIEKKKKEISTEKKQIKKDENDQKDQKKTSKDDSLEKKKQALKQKERELKDREKILRKKQLDRRVFSGVLYYLKIRLHSMTGHYQNQMYLINPFTRTIILKSSFTKICGHKYDIFSKGVVVVGYEGEHNRGHFLVLLDSKKLLPVAKGSVDIYWKSFVEIRDNMIYAVYKENGSYYLGQFDQQLKRVNRSLNAIDKDTFISFYGDFIYVNNANKNGILVLSRKNLKKIAVIKP